MHKISINDQVNQILQENRLEDLSVFLARRKCINKVNIAFAYLFHIFQSAGILMAAIASGYDLASYAWIGALLNACATLIYASEKYNEGLLKQYAEDIKLIRDDTYISEATVQLEGGVPKQKEKSEEQ